MSDETSATWPGEWELVEGPGAGLQEMRQKVPGGWLVLCTGGSGVALTFLPDPSWQWTPPIKQSRKKAFGTGV